VVGKHLAILLPPERFHELEEIRAKVRFAALSGYRGAGQKERWSDDYLSLSVSPIRDLQGKIVGFLRIRRTSRRKSAMSGLQSLIK